MSRPNYTGIYIGDDRWAYILLPTHRPEDRANFRHQVHRLALRRLDRPERALDAHKRLLAALDAQAMELRNACTARHSATFVPFAGPPPVPQL